MVSESGAAKPKGKLWLWTAGAGLLLFGGALIIISLFKGGEEAFEPRPMPVEVEAASPYIFADIIEAIGTGRANESVVLTAQVSDIVKEVHFTEGTNVSKGAILVTLNNAEERAQVSEAVANLTEAKKQFDRTKPLVDQGTLSQAALDAAQRTLDEARARLNQAQARAGDYVITAPFGGVLGLREVSPGTLVSPGTQVTTLDDISIIKVDFSVPEKFLSSLAAGQEIVTRAAAYPGRDFTGVVRTIGTRVDPVTRAIAVRAEIPNEEGLLRPGMLLTVELMSRVRQSLSVPENALIPIGERHYVFRLQDSRVERVEVAIEGRYDGRAEVLSGLGPGDKIVFSGTVSLQDGTAVNVVGQRTPPGLPQDLMAYLPGQGLEEEGPEETAGS